MDHVQDHDLAALYAVSDDAGISLRNEFARAFNSSRPSDLRKAGEPGHRLFDVLDECLRRRVILRDVLRGVVECESCEWRPADPWRFDPARTSSS